MIIYWNTVHLGHAVTERRNEGLDVPLNFFPHIPIGLGAHSTDWRISLAQGTESLGVISPSAGTDPLSDTILSSTT
uniref:Uncharacterized protein n=1 Tax=Klebsiella pneumoniae TaxID=573 RepID=A0A2P1BND1_KLEPN|nr:hypothetical protein [Klebsiella pneumoniae]